MYLNLTLLIAMSNITTGGEVRRNVTNNVENTTEDYITDNVALLIITKTMLNIYDDSTINTQSDSSVESVTESINSARTTLQLFDDVLINETITDPDNSFSSTLPDYMPDNATVTVPTTDISEAYFLEVADEYANMSIFETILTPNSSLLFETATVTELESNSYSTLSIVDLETATMTSSKLNTNLNMVTTAMEQDSGTLVPTVTDAFTELERVTDFSTNPTYPVTSDIVTTEATKHVTNIRLTNHLKMESTVGKEIPEVLQHLDCGLKPSRELSSWFRIVGGSASHMFEWPWVISLRSRGFHSCGATLILPSFLLTAAHCVGVGKDLVAKGATESIKVKKTYIYPGFWRHHDDLALVELEEPFYNLNPICMEKRTMNDNDVAMFIAGWGATKEGGVMSHNQLVSAEITTLPRNICSKAYGRYFTSSMVCAGTADGSTDACHGDSGGPLMQEVNGTWYLKGIISYGKGCGREGSPGVYMKAFIFIDWIAKQVQSLIPSS